MTNNGGYSRPKGYMDWKPKPGSEAESVIVATHQILAENARFGAMSVRQIFYKLVGNYGYDKTEKAYKRLAENLVKARRAQIISFDSIKDDGGTTRGGSGGFENLDSFLKTMAYWGDRYSIDKFQTQPQHIVMFCEAEGMVDTIGIMIRGRGVQITGTGGFSSLTVTHGLAEGVQERWDDEDNQVPTVFMHIGDFDPSGESIFKSMCQDIGGFASEMTGGYLDPETGAVESWDGTAIFTPRRLALTRDQVEAFALPSAPAKSSDSRSRNWDGETTQLEALDNNDLERIVTEAIDDLIDFEKVAEMQAQEDEEKRWLGPKIKDTVETLREEYKNR